MKARQFNKCAHGTSAKAEHAAATGPGVPLHLHHVHHGDRQAPARPRQARPNAFDLNPPARLSSASQHYFRAFSSALGSEEVLPDVARGGGGLVALVPAAALAATSAQGRNPRARALVEEEVRADGGPDGDLLPEVGPVHPAPPRDKYNNDRTRARTKTKRFTARLMNLRGRSRTTEALAIHGEMSRVHIRCHPPTPSRAPHTVHTGSPAARRGPR